MVLLLSVSYLCSRQIQRRSVCTEKRSGENGLGNVRKLIPVDPVVRFYVHIDM